MGNITKTTRQRNQHTINEVPQRYPEWLLADPTLGEQIGEPLDPSRSIPLRGEVGGEAVGYATPRDQLPKILRVLINGSGR
jgi:hypothetical protein